MTDASQLPKDGFSGVELPSVSLSDYMFRLARYMDAWFYEAPGARSVGCRSLVISMMYLYRLKDKKKADFFITKFNVHRLFAVCTLLAAKFSEDYIVANSYWSEVSGIPMNELNDIEELFCNFMQFNFFVTEKQLKSFYTLRGLMQL